MPIQRLKLRRMRVRGFKALADLDLRVPADLLILIGANGAGKSSILQALAFIQYFAKGQPKAFFEDRGWKPIELRTQLKIGLDPGVISYRLCLEDEGGTKIYWFFVWHLLTGRVTQEEVWVLRHVGGRPQQILRLFPKDMSIVGDKEIAAIRPEGSLLALVDPDAIEQQARDVLIALQAWGAGIFSLELLSPVEMRRGARGTPTDIGPRGERLGGFLAGLSAAQKDRLVGRLAPFYPLQGIETTRKRAGWVDLRIAETFAGIGRIGANHMSDGFMRLLGLAAIPEFGEVASTVLLDEIEDGIDPHILPRFIAMIARESKVQLIVTSHSPILVNGFKPDQIAFVARQEDGRSVAASFAAIQPLVEGLQYFGAGEMWTNTDMSKITQWVRDANDAAPAESQDLPKAASIKVFMEQS